MTVTGDIPVHDPGFPSDVGRVMFGTPADDALRDMTVCATWREITDQLLPERR